MAFAFWIWLVCAQREQQALGLHTFAGRFNAHNRRGCQEIGHLHVSLNEVSIAEQAGGGHAETHQSLLKERDASILWRANHQKIGGVAIR